jgi:outer membrane protein assembly factor BamA
MPGRALLLAGAWLWLAPPAGLLAQPPEPSPPASAPAVRSITTSGVKEIPERTILAAARLKVGEPLPDTPDNISRTIEHHYRDEGYAFARATTRFDDASGALTVTIDEGIIDVVEFQGVDQNLVQRFNDEFALRAGDVFNRRRAQQALEVLLRPTRGAVRPASLHRSTVTDSSDVPRRRGTFDLVEREGRKVLLVGLREPAGRFKLVPDLGEREDWFTPVDGFVPSLGMGIALFDHQRFNHAFVAGHLSYKTASERGGYSIGFERPVFDVRKLYVGGEIHDLTASDDQWQVSSIEASLAAIGPRRSFRDYYRRRGLQVNSSLRLHRQIEAVFAWKAEHHYALSTESDFSFWNDDEAFRPNIVAAEGRLNALVVGASADSHGFERESLEASYRRHQLESPFGERLNEPDWGRDPRPVWRIDWTSEIASPDALGGDFDFRRHILTGRGRMLISEHQNVGVRAIRGWSGGTLPPQRLFTAGGIGSVHGYEFKEQVGDALTLLNVEYELGWRGGLKAIGFFDVGRVGAITGSSPPWMKGIGFGFGVDAFRVDFGYRTDAVPSSLQVLLRIDRTF